MIPYLIGFLIGIVTYMTFVSIKKYFYEDLYEKQKRAEAKKVSDLLHEVAPQLNIDLNTSMARLLDDYHKPKDLH